MTSARTVHHVANGHCTTRLIEHAGVPGTMSIWADPLHEGPVPGGVPDDELLQVRASHIAGQVGPAHDVAADLQSWRAALDTALQLDELVLWFEHDLFDQLNLIQVLDRLASARSERTRISLVSLNSYPGRPSFKGLGELKPRDIASLFERRQPVEAAQYELAQRAWRAFRAPEPLDVVALLEGDTSALPYLADSLRRHLEDLPSDRNGLSRTEQRLLDIVAAGETDIWRIFPAMHEGETHFYIADMSFWSTVQDLAACTPPLLEVRIADSSTALPRGDLKLTPAGDDVRTGRIDRVSLGLDRWAGGVHLTASGPVWRHQDGAVTRR